MNIKSKIAAALAVVTLAGGLAVPTSSAHSAAYDGVYYADGYRRCRWERQFNAYGDYVGTVKVCRVY
jgi:hypothetical protein